MNKKRIALSLVLFIALVATIVALMRNEKQPDGDTGGKLAVIASYYPLYDFAKQVGGNKAVVTSMTPAGAEPHDYEPAPRTLARTLEADVFIYNGGHMEPWTEKFIQDYRHTTVKASQGIKLREGQDPHFWLDPVMAQMIVGNIRDGFVKADPANASYYSKNATAYNEKLAALGTDYSKGLSACSNDTVISSHEAFGYVADRYNFKVEAIAGISTDEEPSAARLAEITRIVQEKQLKYIFFESLVSPRLADTIARETGADTLVFDPIEGLTNEDQQQGKDYLTVQRENLQALRTALACS
jgi:zinc transport system substrate-binding protein